MDQSKRQDAIKSVVTNNHLLSGKKYKLNRGFGVSNRALVQEVGLEMIDADMQGVEFDEEVFVFITLISLPPQDELYIAVYIRNEACILIDRLRKMIDLSSDPNYQGIYASKNNNVAILAALEDGKIYLRNKGRWGDDPSDIDLTGFGPSITPDRIEVAVYPPKRDAARSLNVRTFISYLGRLFGQHLVHEIHPWELDETHYELFQCVPAALDIDEIVKKIRNLGGHYKEELIERYHSAINFLPHKHFVILAGHSGTGKTSLAIKYPKAVHNIADKDEHDPFLYVCPVRPDWTDPSSLLGYNDIVTGKYVVPEFLEAVLTALAYPTIPVYICLDEMNLARVEYYFSDILSCVESELPVTLHHNSIPLEGSNGEDIPASISIPSNVYLTGTINIDETTHPISDKVLDRAVVIDMSEVDIPGFLTALKTRETGLTEAVDLSEELLTGLSEKFAEHKLGIGYRTAEEFVRYVAYAKKLGKSEDYNIMDHLLVQKVLTKLGGSERQRSLLDDLTTIISKYPRSADLVNDLMKNLNDMGAFKAFR